MSLTSFVLVLAVVLMSVSLKTAAYVRRFEQPKSNLLMKLVFLGSNVFAILAGLLPFVDAAVTGSQALSGWCKLSIEICALLMVPSVYFLYWFRRFSSVSLFLGSFVFLILGAVCCLEPEATVVQRQMELAAITFAGLLYAVWAWIDLYGRFTKKA